MPDVRVRICTGVSLWLNASVFGLAGAKVPTILRSAQAASRRPKQVRNTGCSAPAGAVRCARVPQKNGRCIKIKRNIPNEPFRAVAACLTADLQLRRDQTLLSPTAQPKCHQRALNRKTTQLIEQAKDTAAKQYC